MHGSAATNGLFLVNGSSVVEIMPFSAQQFSYRIFSWWMYDNSYAHFERVQVRQKVRALSRNPTRWQMSDQFVDWQNLGPSIVSSTMAVQKKLGFNEDISHENLAFQWTDDFLHHSVLFTDVWLNGTHLVYNTPPKSHLTTAINYKKYNITHSQIPMPFDSKFCAKHWIPIIFYVDHFENLYAYWKQVVIPLFLLQKEKNVMNDMFAIIFAFGDDYHHDIPLHFETMFKPFVRYQIFSLRNLIEQYESPFPCFDHLFICKSPLEYPDEPLDSTSHRKIAEFISLFWSRYEDNRKVRPLYVHFGSRFRNHPVANFKHLREACRADEEFQKQFGSVECGLEDYTNFDDRRLRKNKFTHVYVFGHGDLGIHGLFIKYRSAIIELFPIGNHDNRDFTDMPEDTFQNMFAGDWVSYFQVHVTEEDIDKWARLKNIDRRRRPYYGTYTVPWEALRPHLIKACQTVLDYVLRERDPLTLRAVQNTQEEIQESTLKLELERQSLGIPKNWDALRNRTEKDNPIYGNYKAPEKTWF